uniref:Uncharacterized protein n=1 Tax=Arundo donax TaxID=35708 RepID=A0A0A9DUY2_ARUDO
MYKENNVYQNNIDNSCQASTQMFCVAVRTNGCVAGRETTSTKKDYNKLGTCQLNWFRKNLKVHFVFFILNGT